MSSVPEGLAHIFRITKTILPLDFRVLDSGTVPEGRSFCLRHDLENGHVDIACLAQWRSLSVVLQPAGYVAPLVKHLSQTLSPSYVASIPLAYGLNALNGSLQIQQEEDASISTSGSTGEPYLRSLCLQFSFRHIEVLDPQGEISIDVVLPRIAACLRVIADILPITEAPEEAAVTGYLEGQRADTLITRHERDARNRALCIAHHGDACKVCGIRFAARYGEIGAGFIHVHHITPLSRLTDATTIDPVRDLVPVCPNCHNMLHKTEPPMDVAVLRDHLRE